MERVKGGLLIAVALFVACGVLTTTHPIGAATDPPDVVVTLPGTLVTWAAEAQPFERQLRGVIKGLFRQIRGMFRLLIWMFWGAVDWWGGWLKGAAFSLGVAIIAALADSSLASVWRANGLRALVTYATLMLYVYARLLFSGGVNLSPKLLFLGALIYGILPRDFIPDTSLVPGRVEDVVVIAIATRAFVYACPDELVNDYANRAITLRRRLVSFQRPR